MTCAAGYKLQGSSCVACDAGAYTLGGTATTCTTCLGCGSCSTTSQPVSHVMPISSYKAAHVFNVPMELLVLEAQQLLVLHVQDVKPAVELPPHAFPVLLDINYKAPHAPHAMLELLVLEAQRLIVTLVQGAKPVVDLRQTA